MALPRPRREAVTDELVICASSGPARICLRPAAAYIGQIVAPMRTWDRGEDRRPRLAPICGWGP